MIENSDADQIERLNSRIIELLRERDVLVKALQEIIQYSNDPVAINGATAALASLKEPA